MEHVDVDPGSAVEDIVEVFELRRDRARLVRVSPVIEPAGPVFGDKEGSVRTEFGKGIHTALVVADAEVGGGEKLGDGAFVDVAPVVGGEEHGSGEAGVEVDLAEVLDVGVVGSEVSVLVLDLGHEDGTANAEL